MKLTNILTNDEPSTEFLIYEIRNAARWEDHPRRLYNQLLPLLGYCWNMRIISTDQYKLIRDILLTYIHDYEDGIIDRLTAYREIEKFLGVR